jgi:membrane protein involved in colicin uptake
LQTAEPIAPVPSPVIAQQRVIEQVFTAPVAVEPGVAEQPVAVVPEPVVEAEPEPVAAVVPAPAAAVAAPKRARSTAEVVAIADRQRRAPGAKAKAAFTLRLDADRHLKLRLACAVSHRSAQQLVTEALDVFLGSLPELDAMAGHVPASAKRH